MDGWPREWIGADESTDDCSCDCCFLVGSSLSSSLVLRGRITVVGKTFPDIMISLRSSCNIVVSVLLRLDTSPSLYFPISILPRLCTPPPQETRHKEIFPYLPDLVSASASFARLQVMNSIFDMVQTGAIEKKSGHINYALQCQCIYCMHGAGS